ncbi:MAG: hypothetical protein RR595_09465 [Lysinibacillus sp.]
MQDLMTTIANVTTDVKKVAPVLAGLIGVVIGLLWTTAKDAQKKEQYSAWLINVGIGFGIVYLAASLVTWFSAKVVGFS